ncbi:MAG: CopG family transcriptional regulator [Candidatus Aenigmarchaeota archaeon]|nr:CopG family transcriptional regulator [Candidatus Aenigmarchaeota archaeon]MBS3054443.1 CopG family transcriptional regulator [Candidatus Aenigmarchaeota archaeon]
MKVKSTRKIGYKTVSIPKNLYEKLEALIAETGFPNVSQFVVFVMRMILSENEKTMDKTMERKIKSRLKSLGYLGE